MLVSMDLEALTVVVAGLRRFRRDVEDERHLAMRAARAAMCESDLGRMEGFLPDLEDLARDLEWRMDVAAMMTSTGWARTSATGVVSYTLAGQDDSIGAQLAAFATSPTARTREGVAALDERLARYGDDASVMAGFYDALPAAGLVSLMSDVAGAAFATASDVEARRSLLGHLRSGLQRADARWTDLHAGVYAAALVDAATANPDLLSTRRPAGGAGVLAFLLTGATYSSVFLSTIAAEVDTYVRVTGAIDPWRLGDATLSAWAQYLEGDTGGLTVADPSTVLMSALRGNTPAFRAFFTCASDPDAAAARQGFWFTTGDSTRLALAEVSAVAGSPRVSVVDVSPAGVASWWASLLVGTRTPAALDRWDVIGNLDGIPYGVRVAANRTAIANAIAEVSAHKTALQAQVAGLEARLPVPGEYRTRDQAVSDARLRHEIQQAKDDLAALNATSDRYDKYLSEETVVGRDADGNLATITGHQVVVFDPGHGRFAEIVGSITPATRNIGVLVGGTTTNLGNMNGQYDKANSFVLKAVPSGSLAVITYLGGPMPQTIPEAVDTHYALDAAGGLRDFAAGIQRPDGVKVTVLGHSYGGSLVGTAEHVGMKVDRILLVESAGAGPGVSGVQDYADPDTPRYSMTAPGDPIGAIQGVSIGPFGHGADPDELDGVVRLETGRVNDEDTDSALLQGQAAHSGVFTRDSTAWKNMLNVMTGQPVMLYTAPHDTYDSEGYTGTVYSMQDPAYTPPTKPVP